MFLEVHTLKASIASGIRAGNHSWARFKETQTWPVEKGTIERSLPRTPQMDAMSAFMSYICMLFSPASSPLTRGFFHDDKRRIPGISLSHIHKEHRPKIAPPPMKKSRPVSEYHTQAREDQKSSIAQGYHVNSQRKGPTLPPYPRKAKF